VGLESGNKITYAEIRFAARLAGVHNAVNAPEADGGVEFTFENLFAKEGGDIMFVLQDAAIHINDVEAAVGTVDEINRAEALVS
jgi:hypothetical protein